MGVREREGEREREDSNSKTPFDKDCTVFRFGRSLSKS